MRVKIAPSILSADFASLGDQVRVVERAGVDQIHVDVMDGHFVPNLSMGPIVVQALRKVTELPLDVHLMITDPERYLESFVKAGASHISFHIEANGDHRAMLEWLRTRGIGRGIALNPDTPVDAVLDLVPLLDMLLVMTVHPGFSGQSFLGDNLEKVRKARARSQEVGALDIEVDGGIDATTAPACLESGANVFVAGSAIFGAPDPGEAVVALRRSLESG